MSRTLTELKFEKELVRHSRSQELGWVENYLANFMQTEVKQRNRLFKSVTFYNNDR